MYLRLLIFLSTIWIPACASSSPASAMRYSAYKLNKQDDNLYTALMSSFPNFEPVRCSMSDSDCCFLTCIQIFQEAGKVVWYSHLFQNCPQFVVIHTVKGFRVVRRRSRCFSGIILLFLWSSRCWQFELWFLCLF